MAVTPQPSPPRAKKRFGQNFLHDPQTLAAVARRCVPEEAQLIVELGAGTGNLTAALVAHGLPVVCVERDRDLVPLLHERFAGHPLVTILEADAKQLDLARVAQGRRTALCGNIPYHLSAPLLDLALHQADLVERVTYMVQKELGDRLAAKAGTRACGSFSVLLQQRFDVSIAMKIGRGAFVPAPRIDSVLLTLTPQRPVRFPVDGALLHAVVHAGFAQRRKQLSNNLSGRYANALAALAHAGVEPTRRAETLSVEEWTRLSAALGPATI